MLSISKFRLLRDSDGFLEMLEESCEIEFDFAVNFTHFSGRVLGTGDEFLLRLTGS